MTASVHGSIKGNASITENVPILCVTSVISDPVMSPGYPYTVSTGIVNNGSYNAGRFTMYVFLSGDLTLSLDDPFLGSSGLPLLYAGVEKNITITDTFPDSIPDGEYYLIPILEPDNYQVSGSDRLLCPFITTAVTVKTISLPDQEWFHTQIRDELYAMTNKERNQEGHKSLSPDDALQDLAQTYANKMAALRFIGHTDPEGNDQNDRAQNAGYQIFRYHKDGSLWRIGVGENLARMPTGTVAFIGYISPVDGKAIADAIMQSWLLSTGHRKNMMDHYADRIGIGVSFDGHYYYAVQEFF
ncbi:MAG: hypothetical protein JXA44_12800 [Methanospirillaceae archaeon]|nr:hypothetical protein [Methanospirillaceae archaeon]